MQSAATTTKNTQSRVNPTIMAAQVLAKVIDDHESLDRALAEIEGGTVNPKLRECAYGGCRTYLQHEFILSKLLSRPIRHKDRIVHFVIIAAMYQLTYMRSPNYAVVNESVAALSAINKGWAKNLVNGVLRNFIRKHGFIKKHEFMGKHEPESAEPPALDCSPHIKVGFPEPLYQMIKQDWSAHAHAIFATSNAKPPLTLRINQSMTTRAEYCALLDAQKIAYQVTADSPLGVMLDVPVDVAEIPGFAQGQVSVQDESAQLVLDCLELLPALRPDLRILDGCAAPGGKTGLILESEPSFAAVVAVDKAQRVPAIKANLRRIGRDATIICGDLVKIAAAWQEELFDRILLDVPCSGSGVIRRHPDIRFQPEAGYRGKLQTQQLALLHAAASLLKPGGKLLYVTCSILCAENDGVVENYLRENSGIELQSIAQISGIKTKYGIQRLPGVHRGDGFYYALLQKTHDSMNHDSMNHDSMNHDSIMSAR